MFGEWAIAMAGLLQAEIDEWRNEGMKAGSLIDHRFISASDGAYPCGIRKPLDNGTLLSSAVIRDEHNANSLLVEREIELPHRIALWVIPSLVAQREAHLDQAKNVHILLQCGVVKLFFAAVLAERSQHETWEFSVQRYEWVFANEGANFVKFILEVFLPNISNLRCVAACGRNDPCADESQLGWWRLPMREHEDCSNCAGDSNPIPP